MNKTITFANQQFIPHPSGALYWPQEKALLVADLHFEKASHFAEKGYLLPPYDSLETLKLLESVAATYNTQSIIALGDSWHDMRGPERMAAADKRLLKALCDAYDLRWISGNHDPKPAGYGGHAPTISLGGLDLVHEANSKATVPSLCGHYHPKVRLKLRRSSRALPCFAVYESVMVLPAFGAFTGGLDITHSALSEPLGLPLEVYACGKETIYHLPIMFRRAQADRHMGASDAA